MSCIIVFPALCLLSSYFSSRCCFWQIRFSVNRFLGFHQSLVNCREISNGIEWPWIKSALICRTAVVKPLCTFCSLPVWAWSFGVMLLWISAGTLFPATRAELQGAETHAEPRPSPGFSSQIRDSFALQLVQNCCYLLCQSSVGILPVWGARAHPVHNYSTDYVMTSLNVLWLFLSALCLRICIVVFRVQ